MRNRSRIHLLRVSAARLEHDRANPQLVQALRGMARDLETAKAEGRGFDEREKRRVDRQRTAFTMVPDTDGKSRLKEAMMQRAYDLIWDGDCQGADALLEFLPSDDATKVLDAWERDQMGSLPFSEWFMGASCSFMGG